MADNRKLQIIIDAQNKANKELENISKSLGNVQRSSSGASTSFLSFAKSIGIVAGAYAAFKKTVDGVKLGFTVAADLQTAEVGLTTLLGSSEEAAKTIERLKIEAKRTPFELPGLTQATQLLTSVTKDGNESIDILLDVGEALAAMGKGQAELDRIIVNLQQVAATGRAATIDIKQFAFAGIPIYEMLSEATGKYGEELEELISSGGVTFDLLVEMFDKANDEGGRFFGAFENQSGTFNQAVSNMKDSIGIFFSDIVKTSGAFQGLTNALIVASDWLGDYRKNIGNTIETIKNIIKTIDDKTGAVTILTNAISNIYLVFQENLLPALKRLWDTLEPLQPVIKALAKLFGLVLYGALIAVVKLLEVSLIPLITILGAAVDGLNKYFLQPLVTTINFVWEGLKKVYEWAQKAIAALKEYSGYNMVSNAIGAVGNFISGERALGGSVSGGKSYLVGEKGPEIFTPGANGYITPNNKLGGGNIVVNVYGDVSGEELVEKVKEGIMSQLSLNTKFAF